jgi:hypothetical protein
MEWVIETFFGQIKRDVPGKPGPRDAILGEHKVHLRQLRHPIVDGPATSCILISSLTYFCPPLPPHIWNLFLIELHEQSLLYFQISSPSVPLYF